MEGEVMPVQKTPLHAGVEVEIKFTIVLVHIDCQLW
jgi:hypothetical protein